MRTKENTNLRKNLQIYVEEIKKLYLSGIKAKDVAEKYGVSEATMRRFFKENNISLGRRNLKDPELLQELKEKIISLQPNNTVTQICRILGITHNKYTEIMNLKSESKELNNLIDEKFINMESANFCYLLGFFMADGHIDTSHIRIYQSDSDFLHKIQKMIGHTGTLKRDDRYKNTNYCLNIVSPSFRDILNQLKVDSNKKFTAPYVDCGKFSRDFVRGVFDGDGCLSYNYVSGKFRGIIFDITSGSSTMIDGISNFLKSKNIEHSVQTTTKDNTYYSIRIASIDEIIKVMHLLYDNSGEAKLDRKYINFVKFKKLVKMNQEINDIVDTNLKELE